MIDVNSFTWRSNDAFLKYRDGARLTMQGLMEVMMGGLKDDKDRMRVVDMLREGASEISAALVIEQPPVPDPWSDLAEACFQLAELEIHVGDGKDSPAARRLAADGHVAAARAIELFETTIGWDRGARHDLHVRIAKAHFYDGDFEQTARNLDLAGTYFTDAASLGEAADKLRRAIEKTGVRTRDAAVRTASPKSRTGCLGAALALSLCLASATVAVARAMQR